MNRPRKKDLHLPPCVYKRHGAYYYVKGGKWTRLDAGLTKALSRYAALFETPQTGMVALINRVLELHSPKIAKATQQSYRHAAKRLSKILAEFSPDQVKPRDVAAIKVALAQTPNFANRCLSFLRVVFTYAVEQQLVDSNPCIGVARHVEQKRGRYLTDCEYQAIHAKAGPRLQVLMELLYGTGQRVSDVLAIKRADLTAEGIRFAQGKTGAKLTVGWSSELRETVERAKTLHGNLIALTLLHNRRGKSPDYNTIREQWARACASAGVQDARLHDLRAKALTDAKRQGHDPTALAGHASASMTTRYIRLRESPVVSGPSFGQTKIVLDR